MNNADLMERLRHLRDEEMDEVNQKVRSVSDEAIKAGAFGGSAYRTMLTDALIQGFYSIGRKGATYLAKHHANSQEALVGFLDDVELTLIERLDKIDSGAKAYGGDCQISRTKAEILK